MSFLSPDEYNIIMDHPATGMNLLMPQFTSRSIPLDDLKRFRDVGVRTVLEFAPNCETKRGTFDWSLPDEMVARCRKAGLKVLLMGPTTVPQWCPDSWYVWAADNTVMRDHDPRNYIQTWGCLSPWNRDAQAYQRAYIARFVSRYNSDDVLCLQSHSQEGESILPPATACIYDPSALAAWRKFTGSHNASPDAMQKETQQWMFESCARVVIDLQRIYATHPSRTISMQLHPCYLERQWNGSGVHDVESYLKVVKEVIKPDVFLWFLFAWFSQNTDGSLVFGRHAPFVGRVTHELGMSVVTGSEWPEGIAINTPRSLHAGFRALLTAPLHPYLHRDTIEPWVLDAVAQSRREFTQARI